MQPKVSSAFEVWTGGDAASRVLSLYAGATWAPSGSVRADGWRLRVSGGQAHYRYETKFDGAPARVHGTATFSDLLAGYHLGMGELTLKLFAGITLDDHALRPFDASNPVNARAVGFKGVAEAWANLPDDMFLSVNASWADAHESYAGRIRIGKRMMPWLSLGIEAIASGNAAGSDRRGGGFARFHWSESELTASGGIANDGFGGSGGYGTLVYMTRF